MRRAHTVDERVPSASSSGPRTVRAARRWRVSGSRACGGVAVDDRADVAGECGADVGKVGGTREPPAPMAVDVLDLSALLWRLPIADRRRGP